MSPAYSISKTTTPVTTKYHVKNSRARYQYRKLANWFMLSLAGAMTVLALLPLFWIVGYVIYRGGQYINLDLLIHMPLPMGVAGGGVLHAIEGTLVLTLLSSIFAIPPGLLAAFYLAYRPNTPLGIVVRFGTDVLAGVPSIVIGLFIYALVVKTQKHFSALSGGVALAILMLPTIIRTTEEMLKLVPQSLHEAALALGSPEWKASTGIILPAAANGVVTGVMLGIARASGETAPLLFTALGNENYEIGRIINGGIAAHQNIFQIFGKIINQPVDSLPLTLWKYAQQPFPERINQSWAVALVLMLLVLAINILARIWMKMRASRMQGK